MFNLSEKASRYAFLGKTGNFSFKRIFLKRKNLPQGEIFPSRESFFPSRKYPFPDVIHALLPNQKIVRLAD